MATETLTALATGLADGSVRVVDLTQPLSESTPVLILPPPFANTPGLSREDISRYDERGPAWAWATLTVGEHVGTHFDAPIHWITGRDGEDVASASPAKLVAPCAVIDKSAESAEDPDYLLTLADVKAFESEHGPLPAGGWLFLRTGWDARAHDQDAFLNNAQTPGPDVECGATIATAPVGGSSARFASCVRPYLPAPSRKLCAGNGGSKEWAAPASVPTVSTPKPTIGASSAR